MSQKAQLSFTVLYQNDTDIQDIIKNAESSMKDDGCIIQQNSWADLNYQFDVIGINAVGDPWEATISAATEEDAIDQVPEGVTIAKIQQVSPFAADPTGGS